jgi:hypothetical protein
MDDTMAAEASLGSIDYPMRAIAAYSACTIREPKSEPVIQPWP